MLTTKQKVYIARVLAYILITLRKIFGLKSSAIVKRKGLQWSLDLSQGIDLAIYLNLYERDAIRHYNRIIKPGMTVIDIGANIGFHTLHFAKKISPMGTVYSLEPTEFAINKLKKNILLNKAYSSLIHVEQIMLVSNDTDPLVDFIPSSWPVSGSYTIDHPQMMGVNMSTNGAYPMTFDKFVDVNKIGTVDLIKIDVDGNEYDVLCGAEDSINRFKPLLYIEFSPYVYKGKKNGFHRLIEKLNSIGYGQINNVNNTPKILDANYILKTIKNGAGINALLKMR